MEEKSRYDNVTVGAIPIVEKIANKAKNWKEKATPPMNSPFGCETASRSAR